MPPRSFEQTPGNETSVDSSEEKNNLPEYVKLERGDIDFNDPGQMQVQDMQHGQLQTQTTATPVGQQQAKQAPDPVEIVKGMISAGFTPSKAQIMNSGSNLNGSSESSNTWLAVFLQRLIKQRKAKAAKNK